jgi:TolA-binding protein
MRHVLSIPLLLLCCLAMSSTLHGQRTLQDEDLQADYLRAEQLFAEGQYAAAERAFAQLEQQLPPAGFDDTYGNRAQASYYRAVCAVELYHPDAERMLLAFGEAYPEHPLLGPSRYQLGRYHFRNKKYRWAMDWFRQVDPISLAPEDRMDFNFQLGYVYFHNKELANAKPLFAQVREFGDAKHYFDANFYYAYIALEDGELDEASAALDVAALSDRYEKVVPYFRARIAFAKGDDDRAIALAEPHVGQRRQPYDLELHQLLGQAYYRKGEHERALPYLQYYVDKARKLEPEDYFQLGVAQYKAGDPDAAIENLERLDGEKDSLAQQALYLVGNAHMQRGDKEAARSAFLAAARNGSDSMVSRDARFVYAKLSYELGFTELAIAEWQSWLSDYPGAEQAEEARGLLVQGLLRSRDFDRALGILEDMPRSNPALRQAYQEVSFYRGVERYRDEAFGEAETLFRQSRSDAVDDALKASAQFWEAQAMLAQGKRDAGLAGHRAFEKAAAGNSELPGNASIAASAYAQGYALLEAGEYRAAASQFERVLDRWSLSDANAEAARVAADAHLRLGDCRFHLKDYAKADRAYAAIVDARKPGRAYALFQQGMLKGLQGNLSEKTRVLGQLQREHPKSPFADDALYEKGNSHFVLGESSSADDAFEALLNRYPNSSYAARALLKRALIAYTAERYEQALAHYRQVAERFKGSAEAREALAGIRDISVDMGQPEIYAQMGNVTLSAKDSVTWDAAYRHVLQEDCNKAEPALDRYILEFPEGYFIESARFFRAECRYDAKRYASALSDYRYLLDLRASRFRETALLKSARIAFYDLETYADAAAWYGELAENPNMQEYRYEALKGLVRSVHRLGNLDAVLTHAPDWIAHESGTTEDRIEARFYLAKAAMEKGQNALAGEQFAVVAAATQDERGVESRFQLAVLAFEAGAYEETQNRCLDLIRETPSYESWVIRSYILIADALREQGELVQAKAALRSIVESYTGDPALLALAQQKLAELERLERENARLAPSGEDAEDAFIDLDPVQESGTTKPRP